MSTPAVLLQLPDYLYEHANQVADASNRSIEEVLIESIALTFNKRDELPSDEELSQYGDDELWAVVHHRIAWLEQARARDLIALSKAQKLSPEEDEELHHLIDVLDDYMLVRSKALAMLHERGHDTASFFQRHP
jgi:hypothetical protein